VISAGLVAGAMEWPPIIMFGAYLVFASLVGLRIYRSAGVDSDRPDAAPRLSRPEPALQS
jgi:hypothetical protein